MLTNSSTDDPGGDPIRGGSKSFVKDPSTCRNPVRDTPGSCQGSVRGRGVSKNEILWVPNVIQRGLGTREGRVGVNENREDEWRCINRPFYGSAGTTRGRSVKNRWRNTYICYSGKTSQSRDVHPCSWRPIRLRKGSEEGKSGTGCVGSREWGTPTGDVGSGGGVGGDPTVSNGTHLPLPLLPRMNPLTRTFSLNSDRRKEIRPLSCLTRESQPAHRLGPTVGTLVRSRGCGPGEEWKKRREDRPDGGGNLRDPRHLFVLESNPSGMDPLPQRGGGSRP